MTSHITRTSPSFLGSRVGLTSKSNKCQLLLEFNAGHLRGHGILACIDLQSKSLACSGDMNFHGAGLAFKLEINAGKNPMAAQMACIELEKQLTFIALTG